MTGRVVTTGPAAHKCAPGWTVRGITLHQQWCHPGDIWECGWCGQRWHAVGAQSNHATVGLRTIAAVDWRKVKQPLRWRKRREP